MTEEEKDIFSQITSESTQIKKDDEEDPLFFSELKKSKLSNQE